MIIAVAVALLVVYIAVQGLRGEHYALTGVIALIGAWFLWQIWNIVTRNRPRRYDPHNLPADVLPAAIE